MQQYSGMNISYIWNRQMDVRTHARTYIHTHRWTFKTSFIRSTLSKSWPNYEFKLLLKM